MHFSSWAHSGRGSVTAKSTTRGYGLTAIFLRTTASESVRRALYDQGLMRNRCKHVDGATVFKTTLNRKPTMKQLTFITIGIFLSGSLFAGPPEYKQVVPPPPPILYGTGFYGAIDLGANVYQDRGGNRTLTDDNPNSPFFGDSLEVDPKNDVGLLAALNSVTFSARV